MIVETVRTLIRLLRANVFENVVLSAGSIVEITEMPAIILNGPELIEKKLLMRDAERLVTIDIDNEQAVREVPPRWYDLHFDVNISCSGNLELIELFEKFSRINQKFPLIEAINEERERKYSWFWGVTPGSKIDPNISQVYQGNGELIIYDVEVYSDIREVWPLITTVMAEFDVGGFRYETLEVKK